jgi:MFS transporter, DHA1 family, tetracycline resistance protein
VKRSEVRGTVLESHVRWQIRTNGLIGIAFVAALVRVMPVLSRACDDSAMAVGGLALNGLGVLLSGLPVPAWTLWVLAFTLGVGDMVAYTAILTLFSTAAPAGRRDWAGIATAVMAAVAWALTGLTPNLLGEVPLGALIAGSGVCVLLAGALLLVRGEAAAQAAATVLSTEGMPWARPPPA